MRTFNLGGVVLTVLVILLAIMCVVWMWRELGW